MLPLLSPAIGLWTKKRSLCFCLCLSALAFASAFVDCLMASCLAAVLTLRLESGPFCICLCLLKIRTSFYWISGRSIGSWPYVLMSGLHTFIFSSNQHLVVFSSVFAFALVTRVSWISLCLCPGVLDLGLACLSSFVFCLFFIVTSVLFIGAEACTTFLRAQGYPFGAIASLRLQKALPRSYDLYWSWGT